MTDTAKTRKYSTARRKACVRTMARAACHAARHVGRIRVPAAVGCSAAVGAGGGLHSSFSAGTTEGKGVADNVGLLARAQAVARAAHRVKQRPLEVLVDLLPQTA